jgi:hypothetical protein
MALVLVTMTMTSSWVAFLIMRRWRGQNVLQQLIALLVEDELA